MNNLIHYATEEEARKAGVEAPDKERNHAHGAMTIDAIGQEATRDKVQLSTFEGYEHNCHPDFHAFHLSGTRPLNVIRWIVIHDTEGGTAFGIAGYFSRKESGGSAHVTVDDFTCYRSAFNNEIVWGAPGANYKGFHIEQCGYAKWTITQWKARFRTLRRAAWKAAYHCRLFRLPPYFVWADGLKENKKGVTTHAEVTKAFGGTHTDPGKGWPRFFFMTLVRYYHARLGSVKPIV